MPDTHPAERCKGKMVRLEALDLNVKSKERSIIDVKRFVLEEGEIVCIHGENGAGKTTFFLSLLLLIRTKRGQILYRGKRVGDEISVIDFRRKVSISLKEPLLFNTNVFENIASGLKMRRFPRIEIEKRVNEYSKILGIESFLSRAAKTLSDGEAKMVSLARAFVLNPEILILDEPFSSLDSSFRDVVTYMIKRFRDEYRTSVILSSNRDSDIPYFSDRICLMRDGKIIKEERLR